MTGGEEKPQELSAEGTVFPLAVGELPAEKGQRLPGPTHPGWVPCGVTWWPSKAMDDRVDAEAMLAEPAEQLPEMCRVVK